MYVMFFFSALFKYMNRDADGIVCGGCLVTDMSQIEWTGEYTVKIVTRRGKDYFSIF